MDAQVVELTRQLTEPAALRWIFLSLSLAVLFAFLVNYIVQWRRGRPPNPVKVLMFGSGIGFWWFSFVYLEFTGLSVTLFEIAHDVQYKCG